MSGFRQSCPSLVQDARVQEQGLALRARDSRITRLESRLVARYNANLRSNLRLVIGSANATMVGHERLPRHQEGGINSPLSQSLPPMKLALQYPGSTSQKPPVYYTMAAKTLQSKSPDAHSSEPHDTHYTLANRAAPRGNSNSAMSGMQGCNVDGKFAVATALQFMKGTNQGSGSHKEVAESHCSVSGESSGSWETHSRVGFSCTSESPATSSPAALHPRSPLQHVTAQSSWEKLATMDTMGYNASYGGLSPQGFKGILGTHKSTDHTLTPGGYAALAAARQVAVKDSNLQREKHPTEIPSKMTVSLTKEDSTQTPDVTVDASQQTDLATCHNSSSRDGWHLQRRAGLRALRESRVSSGRPLAPAISRDEECGSESIAHMQPQILLSQSTAKYNSELRSQSSDAAAHSLRCSTTYCVNEKMESYHSIPDEELEVLHHHVSIDESLDSEGHCSKTLSSTVMSPGVILSRESTSLSVNGDGIEWPPGIAGLERRIRALNKSLDDQGIARVVKAR